MPMSKIPMALPPPIRKTHSDPDLTKPALEAPPPPESSSCKPCSIPKLVAKRTPEHLAMTMAVLENNHGLGHPATPHGPEPFNLMAKNPNEVTPPKIEEQPVGVDPEQILSLVRNFPPVQPSYKKDNRTVAFTKPMMVSIDPGSHISGISTPASNNGPMTRSIPGRFGSVPDITMTRSQIINSAINLLENQTIMKVFSYLNLSDLRMCREVQRHWNALISHDDSFLDETLFVVQIDKSYHEATKHVLYHDTTSNVQLPFRHCRFQHMDSMFRKRPLDFVFRNSDNEKYTPALPFFQSLRSIEFRDCFLIWKTIKAYLIQAPQVTSVKISNCLISGFVPASPSQTVNEFDEFKAGNAIFGVKSLEIYEMTSLDSITSILRKFNGYSNQALETLKISYHPPEKREGGVHFHLNTADEDLAEAKDFSRELKEIINSCKNSLRILNLDIQHDITLDILGLELTKDLANLGARLNLEEFQLSPRLDSWLSKPKLAPKSPAIMTMNSVEPNITEAENKVKHAAASFAWFLESQRELKTLGLPFIFMGHPDSGDFFRRVLRGLPCASKLKYLAVPSISFLPDELFHVFPSLKQVKIGEPIGKKVTDGWSLFHHYVKDASKRDSLPSLRGQTAICIEDDVNSRKLSPQANGVSSGVAKLEADPNIRKLATTEQLSIFSTVLSQNFGVLMRNMPNLAHLEINSGLETPLIRDRELQLIIKNLRMLRSLVISCADKLTDFGLTGIPEKNCKIMFQNQSYTTNGVNERIWTSEKVTGRPLSDLKGLRKLVLIGVTGITDVGVGYGLAFKELKYCYLPYSDYITDWGIERMCESNPSLESLTFTGLNQHSKVAFQSAKKSHPRIKRGDMSRCQFFMERNSPFWDTMMMGFPTPAECLEAIVKLGGAIKTGASIFWRRN